MSEGWYYADEGAPRGPMSLSDVVQALTVMHDPAATMIWRAGFDGWAKASDVPEVARQVLRPPPLPSPPIPRRPVAEPVVDPDHNFKAEPLPIGGWLIFIALGQTLGPIRFIVSLGDEYSTMDWDIAQRFPSAFIGSGAMAAAYLVLILYATVLFWRRSRHFPRFFWYETLGAIALLPVTTVWVAATMSASSGATFGALFADAFDPKETVRLISASIAGLLWTWYLYKSKRVAKTFIR